jgi:hypothetical protein
MTDAFGVTWAVRPVEPVSGYFRTESNYDARLSAASLRLVVSSKRRSTARRYA